MMNCLISSPGEAMVVRPEDFAEVADAANAVVEKAQAASVYVFGGPYCGPRSFGQESTREVHAERHGPESRLD